MKFRQENEDGTYLHFRIRKEGGKWTADGRCPASVSKAREELKRLLDSMDIDRKGVTEKSSKMLGVTSTLKKGA